MPLLLVACLLGHTAQDADVSPAQLVRIVDGLHEKVRDLAFFYEGTNHFESPTANHPPQPSRFTERFEGAYHYRDDGNTYLDFYLKRDEFRPLFGRKIYALDGDRLETIQIAPDSRAMQTAPEISRGSPAALNMPLSPNRFLYYWYFRELSEAGAGGLKVSGWERVDDHNCLKIESNLNPMSNDLDERRLHLWLDLERGGHPLRVERRDGGNLSSRVHSVRIEEVPLPDGETTWLPTLATHDSFIWGNDYFDEPVIRETTGIVTRSIRVNQGLDDAHFMIDWGMKEGTPGSGQLRREFQRLRSTPGVPRERNDPGSVQERLQAQLAEADEQARMLEAFSAARTNWGWTQTLQLGFGTAGVALLVGIFYFRWKHS